MSNSDTRLTAQQLNTLRQYDTAAVCNAIELCAIQPQTFGYMDGRIQCRFPQMPPMVGYAATATYRTAAPLKLVKYRTLVEQLRLFSETPSPPIVVLQDLDSPSRGATFGEMMCAAYKKFGAVGLITSGAGRDLDQIEATGFPVFTDGVICSHGYPKILDINVPVNVGGLTVFPGDLLHGDRNGVTRIPAEIALDVVTACQEMIDNESILLDFHKNTDHPTAEQFGEALSQFAQAEKKLAEKYRAHPHKAGN